VAQQGGCNLLRRNTVSDERLMQILVSLAVLLFVSTGMLSLARARYPWAKWAKWTALAIFSIAVFYALGMTVRWASG
jgi:hypothetical protein